jgi:hypothetical protein
VDSPSQILSLFPIPYSLFPIPEPVAAMFCGHQSWE